MSSFKVLCVIFLISMTVLPYTDAIFKSSVEILKILKMLSTAEKPKARRGPYRRKELLPQDDTRYKKFPPENKLHVDPRQENKLLGDLFDD